MTIEVPTPINRSSDLDFSLASSISSLIRELQLAAAPRQSVVEGRIQTLLTETLNLLGLAFPDAAARATGTSGRPAQLVAEFLRLAETHCYDRWRLTDYARALHVSAGHLRATCARVTGAPPVRLIHDCLIREAKRRLIGSSLPIGAIALELGFDDAGYFSRLFHAKTGMSPQQYRLSFRQNAPTQLTTTKVE
jgi:AraC family transcriptional regulator, transcriptional activator of pobA